METIGNFVSYAQAKPVLGSAYTRPGVSDGRTARPSWVAVSTSMAEDVLFVCLHSFVAMSYGAYKVLQRGPVVIVAVIAVAVVFQHLA